MTQQTVKLSLTLTAEGLFDLNANGSENTTKLDQCRALMLGIYAIIRDELGEDPDPTTIAALAKWAKQVIG